MNRYLGSIVLFPYNFVPRGWRLCDGALMPIIQFSGLYSLLGTAFGGNGTTDFALPDLRHSPPLDGVRHHICVDGAFPAKTDQPVKRQDQTAPIVHGDVMDARADTDEQEVLRGWVSATTRYRILTTGPLDVQKVKSLIEVLRTQQQILER